MASVPGGGGRGCLDLDAAGASDAEVEDKVDLLASAFGAQVMQASSRLQQRDLGTELCGDERVEMATEQVPVSRVRSAIARPNRPVGLAA